MHLIMIKDYMIRQPYVVSPNLSVQEASDYMVELDIRHLPVVTNGKLKGIVSERELKAALATENPSVLRVADVMKTDVYIAQPKESLSDIASDMASEKVGSAVIVDETQQVIGIFTTTDALKILAESIGDFETDREELEIMEQYSERFY